MWVLSRERANRYSFAEIEGGGRVLRRDRRPPGDGRLDRDPAVVLPCRPAGTLSLDRQRASPGNGKEQLLKRRRMEAAVVTLSALAVVSALVGFRMCSTEIELDVHASQVTFVLPN